MASINDDQGVLLRRETYQLANEGTEEEIELGVLPVDTTKLFDPARNLQPVPAPNKETLIEGPELPSDSVAVTEAPKKSISKEEAAAVSDELGLPRATIGTPQGPTAGDVTLPPEEEGPTLENRKFQAPIKSLMDSLGTPLQAPLRMQLDVGSQIAGGVNDFVANTIDGIGTLLGEEVDGPLRNLATLVPQIEKSDTTVGGFARVTARISTGLVPLLGVSQKVMAGRSIGAKAVATETASSVVDFFAFNKTDDRVADVLLKMSPGIEQSGYFGELVQYLESDPSDTEAEARWKNVAEGRIIGVLGAGILNPKATAGAVMNVMKELQKTNFLRKYLSNEVGAIGRKVNLSQTGRGVKVETKEALDVALAQPSLKKRLNDSIEVVRREGAGSEENLKQMAEDFHVPLEEFKNLNPGVAGNVEVQAGVVRTMRDLHGELNGIAQNLMKDKYNPQLLAQFDAKADELIRANVSFTGITSEAGRTEQAANLFNRAINNSAVGRTVRALRRIDDETVDGKIRLAEFIAATPKKLQGKFLNELGAIQEARPRATTTEVLSEVFMATRFSPATIARNFISTGAMLGSTVFERSVAAGLSKTPFFKESNITFTESLRLGQGMLASFGDGFDAMVKALSDPNSIPTGATKLETLHSAPAVSAKGLGIEDNVWGGVVNTLGNTLRVFPNATAASDKLFNAMATNGNFQALAHREAVKTAKEFLEGGLLTPQQRGKFIQEEYQRLVAEKPKELVEAAGDLGAYSTFTDKFVPDTPLGKAAVSIQDFQQEHPVSKLLLPFFRTPMRVTQANIKRIPLIGSLLSDTEEKIFTRGPLANIQEARALKVAKQGTGAMIMAAGAIAHQQGYLTGDGPLPKQKKELEILKMSGVPRNAFVTEWDESGRPTKGIPYSDLPAGYKVVLQASASATELLTAAYERLQDGEFTARDEEDLTDALVGVTTVTAKALEDQNFAKGIFTLARGFTRGEQKTLSRFFSSSLSVPLAKQVMDVVEPAAKETDSFIEMLLNNWGSRGKLSNQVDLFGNEYVTGNGVFPSDMSPGLVGHIGGKLFPYMGVSGNFDEEMKDVRDFYAEHAEVLRGLTPVRQLGNVKVTGTEKSAYMTMRAGLPFTTPDGKKLEPTLLKGKSLRDHLRETINDRSLEPVVKVQMVNRFVAAAGELTLQRMRRMFEFADLDAAIAQREQLNLDQRAGN